MGGGGLVNITCKYKLVNIFVVVFFIELTFQLELIVLLFLVIFVKFVKLLLITKEKNIIKKREIDENQRDQPIYTFLHL